MAALSALAAAAAFGAEGTISTIAGTGDASFGGDGGPATSAALSSPSDLGGWSDGSYLIADTDNNRIRFVAAEGEISTVAGTGEPGFNGHDRTAVSAELYRPAGVAAVTGGGFLIADTGNNLIRHVSPRGDITTVAGNGDTGYKGDGGPAVAAKLNGPRGVAPLPGGGFLFADTGNRVVRKVSLDGTISTVAGTASSGESASSASDDDGGSGVGDGGPATAAKLGEPDAVAIAADGGFLIADSGHHVVRRVDPTGTISTVAGQLSESGDDGNGGPATAARLWRPTDVEPLVDGGFLISLEGSHRVRRVLADGTIVSYSGTGEPGWSGDGGPGTAAQLDSPQGLAISASGDALIADGTTHRVRAVEDELVPAVPLPDDYLAGAPPALGSSVAVEAASGRVRMRRPGGRRFLPLTRGKRVPVGSLLDARKGSVLLESALDTEGSVQRGTFGAGVFQVRQDRRAHGLTEILLRGGDFSSCRARAGARTSIAQASARRRGLRRLWGRDNGGHFRTHGRDSVATTRGTAWLTVDRCNGTLTRVTEGAVAVRDRRARRTVIVSAGHRYLARRSR